MSQSQCNVLFVFGCGRHGHELAMFMAKQVQKNQSFNKFVMVVDEGFRKEMEDIQTGDRVVLEHVNFQDTQNVKETVGQIIQNHQINWLLLSPPGQSLKLEQIKCIQQAYKQNKGQNVVLLSVAQVDKSQSQNLKQLHELECNIQQTFPKTNTILRNVLPYIDLDFFTKEVKNRKTWRLPVSEGRWAPVSWEVDTVRCVQRIASEPQMNKQFADEVFTLTSERRINGTQLAEMTRSAFNEDVKFEDISCEEAGKILDQYRQRGASSALEQDPTKKLRLHLLTQAERDMILESFEMIKKNEYDFETDHVKKISGQQPVSIDDYLRMREPQLRSQ